MAINAVYRITVGLSPTICMVTYSKCMDQPCKVAHPARVQLNRENELFLSAFAPENLVSRDGFGSPVPRQPAHHLHTLAESGAHSPHSRLNVVLTCGIPPHTVLFVRRANCLCCSRITCYRRIVQFISMTYCERSELLIRQVHQFELGCIKNLHIDQSEYHFCIPSV